MMDKDKIIWDLNGLMDDGSYLTPELVLRTRDPELVALVRDNLRAVGLELVDARCTCCAGNGKRLKEFDQ